MGVKPIPNLDGTHARNRAKNPGSGYCVLEACRDGENASVDSPLVGGWGGGTGRSSGVVVVGTDGYSGTAKGAAAAVSGGGARC